MVGDWQDKRCCEQGEGLGFSGRWPRDRGGSYYGNIALADIANAYDPETITVGGALALEQPEILEPMREEMLRHLNVEPSEVLLTPLGEDAVLYGILALPQEGLEHCS